MVDGKGHGDGPVPSGAMEDSNSSDNTTGDNTTSRSSSNIPMSEDSNNGGGNDGDNALWDQMTAREGRDDARRAGMRTGDWQAEMQLQEALRESRQEADPTGVASPPGATNKGAEEDRSFVDAGFHALANSAVEEEEEGVEEPEQEAAVAAADSPDRRRRHAARGGRGALSAAKDDDGGDKSAMMYSVDGAAAAAAAEAVATAASAGRRSHLEVARGESMTLGGTAAAAAAGGDDSNGAQGDGIGIAGGIGADEDDEDEFDEVELIVTQDGGIIPVAPPATAAAAGGAAVGTVPNAEAAAGEETSGRKMASRKKGCKGGAGSGFGVRDDGVGTAAVRKVRKSGVGKGSTTSGVEEEQHEGQHKQQQQQQQQQAEEGEQEEDGEEEEEIPLPPDIVLTLPDDVLHRTMLFLHPEDILECRAVSSRWEFPGDEAVFEGLCRRTYLAQSAKKLLNVDRWRSWQRMFKFRPRLRDTGLYSLKTTYYKKPVRDMCTEWTPGKVLKVTYYRYFRFFGDGRVAYGLTHDSPKEFVRMLQEGSPKVVYGTYTISKWEVNVEIPNPWSWVNFTLQLANGERGRFTHLVMLRHSSVPRNDARVGRCNHKVKSSDFFTFRRVWQF